MKRILLSLLLLTCFASLQAQEAFYIYRNDGNFDGFFFDQVERIGVSKIDLAGVEHDEYVIQEVQTADSLYRIPLAAIDSVGFQQPDIIFNSNLVDMTAADCPVRWNWMDYFFSSDDGYTITWPVDDVADLPKPGMVLYLPEWRAYSSYGGYRYIDSGPFIGKVAEVHQSTVPGFENSTWYDVVCEPVTDLNDVFEQLISVEQLGTDEYGETRHRMAGADRIVRRVSGNKDITLINLSGSFPFSREKDKFSAGMSLDLSLKIRAQVVYNISRAVTYIGVTLKEDAEVGTKFWIKANLEETTTWYLGGAPVYFPSILPVFQIDPSPEAFIKTTGDLSLSVSSPKYVYHGTQQFHLGTDGVSGSCTNDCPGPGSDDNGWSMEISLNGSMQAGSNFPVKLETNRWAEKAIYASVGADVYVGPKLSASFSVDPVALVNGDTYKTLSGTKFTLAPICTVFEASAEYSFGKKPKKKEKFYEGEISFLNMDLLLFPNFEKTVVISPPSDDTQKPGKVTADIFPRGSSAPYVIGLGAYNFKKQLVDDAYGDVYAFYNTFDKQTGNVSVLDGKYYIVPLIQAFGYNVPAWGSEVEVTRSLIPYWSFDFFSEDTEGYGGFHLYNIFPEDKVEFELVSSYKSDSHHKEVHYKDDEGILQEDESKYVDTKTTGEAGDQVIFTQKTDDNLDLNFKERPTFRHTYKFHNMYESYGSSYGSPYQEGTYETRQHLERGTFRVKVTREDGRVLYTSPHTFYGHGKIDNDGEITLQ